MKIIKKFLLGSIENNCFLIEVNNKVILIDAPMGSETIISYLEDNNLNLDYLFLTHTHYDHILGLDLFYDKFPNLKIYVNKIERNFLRDPVENLSVYAEKEYIFTKEVNIFDDINPSDFGMEIYYISGHSKSSAVFYFPKEKTVFAGDTLFKGTIGRSDLNYGDMSSLIAGIKQHLMILADETVVYPGHGGSTTIGDEKKNNNYMR
jgi:hydroxyacylglutathione hydrolase